MSANDTPIDYSSTSQTNCIAVCDSTSSHNSDSTEHCSAPESVDYRKTEEALEVLKNLFWKIGNGIHWSCRQVSKETYQNRGKRLFYVLEKYENGEITDSQLVDVFTNEEFVDVLQEVSDFLPERVQELLSSIGYIKACYDYDNNSQI